MRFVTLLLAAACAYAQSVAFPGPGLSGGGGGGSYGAFKTLTFDHTKVPSTQTNFPVLVSGTYIYLRVAGSGGSVQSSSGYDIVFGTNSSCSSLLNWEQEIWTSTTGVVSYWVLIPSLSSSSDTVIYMCYGNAAISSFQGGASSTVWDSNFKFVGHFPNGSSLTVLDSTGNANNGTNRGTVTATAGQIDGAASLSGSNDVLIPTISIATNLTLECWVNSSTLTTQFGWLITKHINDNWALFLTGAGQIGLNGGASGAGVTATAPSNSNWHHIVGTIAGTAGVIYVDGSATSGTVTALGNTADTITAGSVVAIFNYTGSLDEVRISDIARSANWITAEYNNQSSPSTFYTVT